MDQSVGSWRCTVSDGRPRPGVSVRRNHGGTASPATVKPEVWKSERAPMVDAIEIVGAHPEACGIEAEGTMQMTFTRVIVRKAKDAIRLVKRNRNTTFGECHFYENTGVGVYLDHVNLHQINVANCHISYNAGGGVVAKGSEIRNLQISGCDIEGNMGDEQSAPTANVWLDSTDSSVGEVAIVGCTIQHTHDAPDSANIRINGFSNVRDFTEERRTGNITIADNVLSDVQVNVQLSRVRGITISGNTMWKGYSANVIAKGCDQIVMHGNLYDRNPRYHYGDGVSAKLGNRFEDCTNISMTGEHYGGSTSAHPADLQFRNCDGVNLVGCTFAAIRKAGILLDSVEFAQITGCLFTGISDDAMQLKLVGKNDYEYRTNRFRRR